MGEIGGGEFGFEAAEFFQLFDERDVLVADTPTSSRLFRDLDGEAHRHRFAQ
jgi:hypothetical protein